MDCDWCNGEAIRFATYRWEAAVKIIHATYGYVSDEIAFARKHCPDLLPALAGLPVPARGIL